jgi:putative ABC transport system permease protein
MNRAGLLMRLLLKASWVRKDRALTALVSVAVVATVATVATTLYADLENKLSHEFRRFGANVVITAGGDNDLTAYQINKIRSLVGTRGTVVPVAYAILTGPNNTKVVVGGTDLNGLRELNSWWSLRPVGESGGPALLGVRAAEKFSPTGSPFTVSFGGKPAEVRPGAIFLSGSEDDSRIYIDQAALTALTGVRPNTALVRIEGRPAQIQHTIAQLSAAFRAFQVEPVRQITQAQAVVVGKTRSVVVACSAVVVVLIMLSMIATFTSSVLERRKDFAVMKALGASNRAVNLLFAAEAALLALAGAMAGFVAGSTIAYWIGKANFDAAILPEPALILPVLAGSVLLALLASTAPLRMLQQIQPAGILRGE